MLVVNRDGVVRGVSALGGMECADGDALIVARIDGSMVLALLEAGCDVLLWYRMLTVGADGVIRVCTGLGRVESAGGGAVILSSYVVQSDNSISVAPSRSTSVALPPDCPPTLCPLPLLKRRVAFFSFRCDIHCGRYRASKERVIVKTSMKVTKKNTLAPKQD